MRQMVRDNGALAVYLLHFDQPVSGFAHYVGVTNWDRLQQRMIEHTTGRGARLTSSACRAGVGWRLAHVWRTDQPALEAALIKRGERRQLCPVCRRISTGIPYRPTKKASCTSQLAFSRFDLSQPTMFPNMAATAKQHSVENTP